MSANIRPSGVFDTTYEQDIALNRTRGDKLIKAGLFLLLMAVPFLTIEGPLGLNVVPQFWVGMISRIAIFTIAVQGLNLLVGFTGQVSLGHAAFIAVGGYTSAILGRELGLSFWFALPLAALFTGGVGLIFGLPSLRVKGFYLVMATLAAQFIIPWVLQNPLEPWTNGTRPLDVPIPTLGPISFASTGAFYYIAVPLSVLLMLAARNIIRTRTGRALISVRDNDLAAELLGINVFSYKLQAFFLSSLYAGVAGALMAYDSNSLTPTAFDLNRSIELLAMLIIGGAGFPLGALFGVGFITILRELFIPALTPFLREVLPQIFPFVDLVNISGAITPILFGSVLIAFLIFEPHGLAHRWEVLKISWKLRPFSH